MSIFIAYSSQQRRLVSAPAPIELMADSILVEEVAAGSEVALSMIYDRYAAILFGMLMRILKDRHSAEEVLQDLFLQIWLKPAQFDGSRGCLATWLFVIGRNRAISLLRRGADREVLEEKEGDYADTFVSRQNVEHEAAIMEMAEKLKAALVQLPPEQRQALELAYFDGMSQSEIAARTGSPLGTVKSRLRTALQSLRRILENREGIQLLPHQRR